MKALRKIVFLMIIVFPTLGMACEVPEKMHVRLFKSNLIAKAKIVGHTDHYYEIKILDIYRDNQSGIKEGDTLKIKKEMNVITSVDKVHRKNIENQLTGVALLSKSDIGWRVSQFSFFYEGIVTLSFNYEYCRIRGTSDEVKTQIQEYFKEFEMINGKLNGKKTRKEVLKSNLDQLALTQYARLFLAAGDLKFHGKIYERINCGAENKELKNKK